MTSGDLSDPVPGVEMTCFDERLKHWPNAVNVGVAVLFVDDIQFSLKSSNVALLDVCRPAPSAYAAVILFGPSE